MLDLGEMHPLTAVFILLELMMLAVQLYFYLMWPYDKSRLSYLVLLALLLVYNLAGGFFPDPGVKWLPLTWQNVAAYGSGFLMAAYFPYYFYRSFDLRGLRLHALYGAPLLLLLPYLVFFVWFYPMTGDLDFAIGYGLILPGLYSPVLLSSMFLAIRQRFKNNQAGGDPCSTLEVRAVYWAVSPWVLMCLFSYLRVAQWIEVLFTNTGFVIIAVLFFYRSGRYERQQKSRWLEFLATGRLQQADFHLACLRTGLSSREQEVAWLLCRGLKYKQIGEALYISARTVDAHARRIYEKLGVKNKTELQRKLGFLN
jgi:DNA-binding CsgD family transcriptional regulator